MLFFLLPVVRSSNASVTLLSLPPATITRASSARIHKIFFEEFNTPAFCLVDSALTSTFAVGLMGACVVDVGKASSSVACVQDALTLPATTRSCPLGFDQCIAYLAAQLAKDTKLVEALQSLPATSATGTASRRLLDLARELFVQGYVAADSKDTEATSRDEGDADDDGNFDVLGALTKGNEKEAIAEQERRNREQAEAQAQAEAARTDAEGAAADATDGARSSMTADGNVDNDELTVSFVYQGAKLRISKASLSTALTPLTDPAVLGKLVGTGLLPESAEAVDYTSTQSVAEMIRDSIHSIDPDRRNAMWELLVITGAPTKLVKGFNASLVGYLQRFVASGSGGEYGEPSAGGPGPSGMEETGGGFVSGGLGGSTSNSPGQPTNVRSLKTPDYFTEFKDRTDLAPFLGATIYAKLVFADTQARGYTLKATYSDKGPGSAFAVSVQ